MKGWADGQTEGWTDEWTNGMDENYIPLRHTSYARGIISKMTKPLNKLFKLFSQTLINSVT